MTKHDIAVQTLIYRNDGRLFADLGTMRWPGVDDEVVAWFAASCKTTAFWLIGFPEATSRDSYTLKYRTIVSRPDGSVVSDTTLLEFSDITYADVIRFEQWALKELMDLLLLFERKHGQLPEPTRSRSKIMTVARVLWQRLRNRRN